MYCNTDPRQQVPQTCLQAGIFFCPNFRPVCIGWVAHSGHSLPDTRKRNKSLARRGGLLLYKDKADGILLSDDVIEVLDIADLGAGGSIEQYRLGQPVFPEL